MLVEDEVAKILSAAGLKLMVSILRGWEEKVISGWLSPEVGSPLLGIRQTLT